MDLASPAASQAAVYAIGLKKMKVRNWREKYEERRLWKEIVKQAKTHQGL